MDNQLKIVVELHEGEKATKKIWRFGVDLVQSYTKTQLEEDIECLFPHVSCLPSLVIAVATTALQSYGLLGSR